MNNTQISVNKNTKQYDDALNALNTLEFDLSSNPDKIISNKVKPNTYSTTKSKIINNKSVNVISKNELPDILTDFVRSYKDVYGQ